MLQNQYFNSKLTHDHIEKILTNYNIKYNTMKNEIDAKFNTMIKLFINDIKAFLENIEEISNERKKIKDAENTEVELAILKNKLEEKKKSENQLKNEVELLTKENESLKKKIKFKEQIIQNKNLSVENTSSDIRLKTENNPTKNKYKKFTTGSKTTRRDKNNLTLDAKTEEKKPVKNKFAHKNKQLSLNLDKNILILMNKYKYYGIDADNPKYTKTYINSKKKSNNSMDKRIVKKKSNTKKNMNSNDKSPEVKSTQETKSTSNIQNAKNKTIINDEKLSTVEMPFSDQSYIENESITTDEILEDEIKELEKEEENIILLMDKIKQLNQNV
jgi:hypothetical protein